MILKFIFSYTRSITITTSLIGMASLVFSNNIYSDDLLTIYRKAVDRDPIIAQARATYEAERQNLPIALSELLPKLILRAGISSDKVLDFADDPNVRSQYFSLNLSQSLFEWDKIQRYLQAEYVVQKAIHDLEAAKQDLLVRVSEAYFNVLEAEDILEYTKTEKIAINEMFKQAEARFDVGLIAIADVEEAKARYNVKSADEIRALNEIANRYEELSAIVGERIQQIDILSPSFKAAYPKPSIMEKWVVMAIKRNHTLMSQELAYCIMDKNEDIAFAGHLPNLRLNARYTGRRSNTTIIIDEISAVKGYINTYGASLDGSWELFAGGGTQAKIDQARFNTHAEGFNTEKVRRGIISDTRQSYRNIITSLSQIQALQTAQLSSMSALDATKAGYDLGTRASIDVLDRLTDLYNQKQRLAIAKYTYIKNIIKLKQYSGVLSNEDMAIVNKWLISRTFKNKNHLDKADVRDTVLDSMKKSDAQRMKEIEKDLKQPLKTDTANKTQTNPENAKNKSEVKKTEIITTTTPTTKDNNTNTKSVETKKIETTSKDGVTKSVETKKTETNSTKDSSKPTASGTSTTSKSTTLEKTEKTEKCAPNTICDKIQSNIKKSEIDSYLNLELPALDDEMDDIKLGANIKEPIKIKKNTKKTSQSNYTQMIQNESKQTSSKHKESTVALEEKLQQIIADYRKHNNEN